VLDGEGEGDENGKGGGNWVARRFDGRSGAVARLEPGKVVASVPPLKKDGEKDLAGSAL